MPLFNTRVKRPAGAGSDLRSKSGASRRIGKFFSYYRPYKRLFAADLICAMIVSAVSLIFPLCVRFITDHVLFSPPEDSENLFLLSALGLLGLVIVQTSCALFYDHMGHVMGARMERDMRNELFAHYQTLPFRFFDQEKTGAVISRLTEDLLSLAELYHHGPEDLIIYAMSFTGALVILFHLNMGLALVISAFLPFMLLFSVFYAGVLNRAYTQNYENIGAINARIDDSIGGIRTVKAFGNEELEAEKFKKANEAYYRSRAAIYKQEARYFTGMGEFFARLIMAVVLVMGGVKLSNASLDISGFISFVLYVSYLTAPIPQLARITAQYQQGISGFNRFMDILELPGEGRQPASARGRPREPDKNTAVLEFANVSFKYREEGDYILRDVSFRIEPGDFIALTGPSGIGKTTLCSLVPRFYDPCAGNIFMNGTNIRDLDLHDLRGRIGIVQQDMYIFSGTIGENIAYGKPGAADEEIIDAAKKANAHDFIMTLPGGYGTVIGSRGLTLSGGQKQRLCIARVFLRNPPLLIFDEASSALDYENEQIIQEALASLSKDRSVIVIAHRLSTIRNAGRVFVLSEGGVRESPDPIPARQFIAEAD